MANLDEDVKGKRSDDTDWSNLELLASVASAIWEDQDKNRKRVRAQAHVLEYDQDLYKKQRLTKEESLNINNIPTATKSCSNIKFRFQGRLLIPLRRVEAANRPRQQPRRINDADSIKFPMETKVPVAVQEISRRILLANETTLKRPAVSSELCSSKQEDKKFKQSPRDFREMIAEMGGSNVTLVIEKELYKSDISRNQGRFSIPSNKIKNGAFITEKEKADMNKRIGKRIVGMEVKFIEPSLEMCTLSFKKWEMAKKETEKSSTSYVLTGNWNSVVNRNKLKELDKVRLWSFRIGSELCFALVVV